MKRAQTDDYSDAVSPGNKVGILRGILKLTQAQMADILGVSRGTISSYEGRKNANPSPEAIRKLAAMYKIDVAWFYDGQARKDDSPFKAEILAKEPVLREESEDEKPRPSELVIRLEAAWAMPPTWATAKPNDGAVMYEETLEPYRTGDLHQLPNVKLYSRPYNYRALVVSNDDLGARAPRGSVIFFRKASNPTHGSIVLMRAVGTPYFGTCIWAAGEKYVPRLMHFREEKQSVTFLPYDFWGYADTIVRPYVEGEPNTETNEGKALKAMGYVTDEYIESHTPADQLFVMPTMPTKTED